MDELLGNSVFVSESTEGDAVERAAAVQDGLDAEIDAADCEEALEAAAAENALLGERVAELESAIAGLESRFELERSLMDAGVVDLETAMALAEPRMAGGGDAASVVSGLVSSKPFLFRSARPGVSGSAMSGAAARETGTLSGMADEARRTGDRRALTRYLRKRRQG